MKRHRTVKLHARCRPCHSSNNGLKEVPWLNVSGVWLEKAGFPIGTSVKIRILKNELVITPAETNQ